MSALQRAQINEVPSPNYIRAHPHHISLSFSSLQLPPRVHNRKNGVLAFPNPSPNDAVFVGTTEIIQTTIK